MRDDQGVDDTVLRVPLEDPNRSHTDTLDDLPQPLRDEISRFFAIDKQPEGRHVMVDGWFSREDGLTAIDEASDRWKKLLRPVRDISEDAA